MQVEEPPVTGQMFFGAVVSEQAVRTTEAMMAVATRRRRIIGVSPMGKGGPADLNNVRPSPNAEMAFSYQKLPVSYQKEHFSYHLPSRNAG